MKIVGVNFIKTKKGDDGVLLSVVGPFNARDTQAHGEKAETEYIARDVYDAVAGSIPPKSLIGRECRIIYGKGGFVDDLVVADK